MKRERERERGEKRVSECDVCKMIYGIKYTLHAPRGHASLTPNLAVKLNFKRFVVGKNSIQTHFEIKSILKSTIPTIKRAHTHTHAHADSPTHSLAIHKFMQCW